MSCKECERFVEAKVHALTRPTKGQIVATDYSFVVLEGRLVIGKRPVITIEPEGYMVVHGSVSSAWLFFLHLGWIALAAALLIL